MTRPASSPPPRPARQAGAWRAPLRASGLLSLLALCVASPLAVVSLLGASAVAGQPATFGVPPGVSDDGQRLPPVSAQVAAATGADGAAAAASAHGLQLRHGCRWGQPGRAPYRGSTRQALQAAGLPEEVVAQIEAQRNAGQKSGRLAIGRDGIRHTGDGRVFPAEGLALTFGMTLCQDSSVNFAKGHVEMADLYEARDAQGRPHAVMVPDVCGNVSVLGTQASLGKVAGMAATLARRAQALAVLADALDPPLAGRPAATLDPGAHRGGGAGEVDDAAGAKGALGVAAGGTGAPGVGVPGTPTPADGPLPDTQPGHRPAVLVAVGAATPLLVPPQLAGGVVRNLGRVTAAAGRGLESLAGTSGATPAAAPAGGNSIQAVPEPGSLWTAMVALAALGWVRLVSRPGPSCRPCASSSSSGRRPSSSSSSPASARTA